MLEFIQHLASNWDDVLTGAVVWGTLSHAVNTFPQPKSALGQWVLGTIQFAVGQRDKSRLTQTPIPSPKE